MVFKVGETVVYPHHGAAVIEAIKTRPLSTRIAVEVCRAITGIELDIRRTPGTTLANSHTGEVIYTPPEGEARLRAAFGIETPPWEDSLERVLDALFAPPPARTP